MRILGIGAAQPPHAIDQDVAAELSKGYCCTTEQQERVYRALYRRTHVRRRGTVLLETSDGMASRYRLFQPLRSAADRGPTTAERLQLYAEAAPALAIRAARAALDEARVHARSITHLVTASCTGFHAPGVDIALLRELPLRGTVERTNVGFMGCHAALNALRVARGFVGSDPAARVLVVPTELCSLHFQCGWDPERIVANALFGDGAAAVVAGPDASAANGWRLRANGACLFPDSLDEMTWRIDDHGFIMTLSARVPALIGAHLRPWLTEWLAAQDLALADVRSWAIHPGGPRIVSSVLEALALPESVAQVSHDVLANFGNMSSPTVIYIIDALRRAAAPLPCVALAFGPGLAAEAALFA